MRTLFLLSVCAIAFSQADQCAKEHTSQATCDADSGCTWCKCGALPSQCWTLEDAKKLPAGVYVCDKSNFLNNLKHQAAAQPSIALPAVKSAGGDACGDKYSAQSTCDADSGCTWCKCGALPSQCWTLEDAKKLPAGVYICDKQEELSQLPAIRSAGGDACGDKYSAQSTCDADSGCTWCKCGALPSQCWTLEDAKKLPAGVYICDKQEELSQLPAIRSAGGDACGDKYSAQSTCDADSGCTWCKCGALPSQCWTLEDAKKLPAGVYICDKQEELSQLPAIRSAGGDACGDKYSAQSTCDADSGCTWCKCGALPSQCWTLEDAKKLPAGVYICDKQEELSQLPAIRSAGGDACGDKYSAQSTCDADSGCTWCKCGALPSQCWTLEDAKKLPAGVYICDKQEELSQLPAIRSAGGDACGDKYSAQSTCDADSGCTWCKCGALPSQCWTLEDAKKLPAGVYICDKQEELSQLPAIRSAGGDACGDKYSAQSTCDADSGCTWCKCGALPSQCWTLEDAKKLPAGVYICDKQEELSQLPAIRSAGGDACGDKYSAQSTCDADSGCTWCKCGALPSQCWTLEDAKKLPAGVYICDKQEELSQLPAIRSAGGDACGDKYSAQSTCDADSGCTWCKCGALPSQCWTLEDAKKLPAGVYICDKQEELSQLPAIRSAGGDACGDKYSAQSTCDADSGCTWCKCGALPSQCWTLEDAKKLPAGVYICDKQEELSQLPAIRSAGGDACGDKYSAQSTCDADSGCTWCKCGALPSQCWTLEDAKKLPAGVYVCDKSNFLNNLKHQAAAQPSIALPAVKSAGGDACGDKYSAQSTCDADSGCTWCKCGALPSQCWTLEDAKKLPAGVYICDKQEELSQLPAIRSAGGDACGDKYSAQSTCDADSGCTWCKCGALPSQCWTLEDAKKLPAGVYICDKQEELSQLPAIRSAGGDACGDKYSAQSTCDADSGCTWCKCGALPSQCWTLEDAKKLPAGVYICDKQEELSQLPAIRSAGGDACGDKYSAQSTCDADSGCTWCKCGALPSQCWTLEDAKKLPAGVYICDKQEELSQLPAIRSAGGDACGDKYSAQSTCDADSGCTWCKCGALPSQCWTLEDAKKLPAGVYICDKQEELSQLPAIRSAGGDACGDKYSAQSTCDADSGCTWCKCGALPSQCWTLEDAKKLPAGVYICDKQ